MTGVVASAVCFFRLFSAFFSAVRLSDFFRASSVRRIHPFCNEYTVVVGITGNQIVRVSRLAFRRVSCFFASAPAPVETWFALSFSALLGALPCSVLCDRGCAENGKRVAILGPGLVARIGGQGPTRTYCTVYIPWAESMLIY